MSDTTETRETALRKAVREAVQTEIDWEVTKVEFKPPFDARPERGKLFVTLFFKKLDKPFSGQLLQSARRAAIASLREQGETRMPLIFPRLNAKQKVASF